MFPFWSFNLVHKVSKMTKKLKINACLGYEHMKFLTFGTSLHKMKHPRGWSIMFPHYKERLSQHLHCGLWRPSADVFDVTIAPIVMGDDYTKVDKKANSRSSSSKGRCKGRSVVPPIESTNGMTLLRASSILMATIRWETSSL